MIVLKSSRELELMKEACQISAEALMVAGEAVKPGVSTKEIDEIAYKFIKKHGATPNFLNYGGFPATACISINDEVIHGIPKADRILKEGDIVSIDLGAAKNGYNGDNAATFACGTVSDEAKRLMDTTRESLYKGIEQAVPGNRIGDIGHAGRGIRLLPGMTLAIEPMINLGTYKVKQLSDGWTVKTADGKLAAHFEHSIAITPNGPVILTKV